jgi:hypothetical protein
MIKVIYHRSDKDNDKNEMVEAGGLAKRGDRVERISEGCRDETDLFRLVRNLNQHPSLLLPPRYHRAVEYPIQ